MNDQDSIQSNPPTESMEETIKMFKRADEVSRKKEDARIEKLRTEEEEKQQRYEHTMMSTIRLFDDSQ